MTSISALGGSLIVALVAFDLGATVLHPSMQGPLSRRAERAAWVLVRGCARRLRAPRLVSLGGPAAMGADLVTWLAGLWLGFALIYAPFTDDLIPTAGSGFEDQGVMQSLYLSGVSLTTVGFGDVVAGTDALRLATVIEAVGGLAVITAAISFITAIYPRVSLLRVAASSSSDLGVDDGQGAARRGSRMAMRTMGFPAPTRARRSQGSAPARIGLHPAVRRTTPATTRPRRPGTSWRMSTRSSIGSAGCTSTT